MCYSSTVLDTIPVLCPKRPISGYLCLTRTRTFRYILCCDCAAADGPRPTGPVGDEPACDPIAGSVRLPRHFDDGVVFRAATERADGPCARENKRSARGALMVLEHVHRGVAWFFERK